MLKNSLTRRIQLRAAASEELRKMLEDTIEVNLMRLPPAFCHRLAKYDLNYCKNCISPKQGKNTGAACDPPLRIGSTCLAMRLAGFSQCPLGLDLTSAYSLQIARPDCVSTGILLLPNQRLLTIPFFLPARTPQFCH